MASSFSLELTFPFSLDTIPISCTLRRMAVMSASESGSAVGSLCKPSFVACGTCGSNAFCVVSDNANDGAGEVFAMVVVQEDVASAVRVKSCTAKQIKTNKTRDADHVTEKLSPLTPKF